MTAFNLDDLDAPRCPRDPNECKKHLEWDFEDVTKLWCKLCNRRWELPYKTEE